MSSRPQPAQPTSGVAAAVPTERGRPAEMRLALSPDEAASALGVSSNFLDQHVMPELRVVRRGRRRLIPVRELERWLNEEACRVLDRR